MEDAPSNELDVSLFSYEEWITFFFGQRLLNEGEYFPDAFSPQGLVLSVARPEKIVEDITRMNIEFSRLGAKYSLLELDQGLWAIGCSCELTQFIWKAKDSNLARLSCVRSMVHPYADFLAGHPAPVMENCFSMWFDMLSGSFWGHVGYKKSYDDLSFEDRELLNAIFDTLCTILDLNDERCQSAALHGLGHLRHPNGPARVQAFIDANRDQDLNLEWLHQCRDGTVM